MAKEYKQRAMSELEMLTALHISLLERHFGVEGNVPYITKWAHKKIIIAESSVGFETPIAMHPNSPGSRGESSLEIPKFYPSQMMQVRTVWIPHIVIEKQRS